MERIIKATTGDVLLVHSLFCALWPDFGDEALMVAAQEVLASDDFAVFLYYSDNACYGFIYMSIRTDYVQGSSTSPTGYIEGIYVAPDHRRLGVAAKLVSTGEDWVRAKGYIEVGCDVDLDNHVSQAFHLRAGFQETGRLVTFIKSVG